MTHYTVALPHYTIGTGAYAAVNTICRPFGRRTALIVGRHGYPAMLPRFEAALAADSSDAQLELSEPVLCRGECTETELQRLCAEPAILAADMLFGIGGGKVLDTAKACAERLNKPVFTFPTIASNCAAVTSVSIIYSDTGEFVRPYFLRTVPQHCFIDSEIIAQAPARYLWAGMGDTYTKYFEAEVSSRGEKLNHPLTLGVHLSRQCADNVFLNGGKALADNRLGQVSDELEQVALTVLVTTGLVSILVTLDHTPDYNSDLAHAIYYTLTTIPGFDHHEQLHGAVVSYGTLVLLLLDSEFKPEQRDTLQTVLAFNREVELPVCLADVGLDWETVKPYLPEVTKMSDIRHHPYEITVEQLQAAMLELERWAQAQ